MNDLATEKYYDLLAEKYDVATLNSWSSPEQVNKIITSLNKSNQVILNIGIGTGQCIRQIYDKKTFKHIEGIDLSQNMLEYCKTKYPDIVLHKADFLTFTKFKKEKYDLIICSGALEFIPDIEGFFRKCAALLSFDGDIVLTYEPRIEGHSVQNSYVSETRSERLPELKGFKTYRHDLDFFKSLAEKFQMKIFSESLFVSYKKYDKEVIYNLVHLKKIT